MILLQSAVRQYKCAYRLMQELIPTHTNMDTNPQLPSGMSSAPQRYLPPLFYNFTPINLTHLITVPAPQPQRSHILHTPLPPFWTQPQLWNPTTNNSLVCSVPLDLLTIPPATNYGTSCNPKSKILSQTQERWTLVLFFLFMHTVYFFIYCIFITCTHIFSFRTTCVWCAS